MWSSLKDEFEELAERFVKEDGFYLNILEVIKDFFYWRVGFKYEI